MTTMDKAAIGWSIAIVAIGVAIAFGGQNIQDLTPDVTVPEPPAPIDEVTEPTIEKEAQMTDPFADIAAKVKSGETTKPLKAGWERTTSETDPGVGHEEHQLAILLPPSDKIYSGTLRYEASEPIQLVSLMGPLAPGEEDGKAIWTPDGEKLFELTFVDPKSAVGEWEFSGNALAVHTMKTTPFTVDYKLDYTVKESMQTKPMEEVKPMEKSTGPKTVNVSIPEGSAEKSCVDRNECYIPETITINVGDKVIWTNDDPTAGGMPHTVTAGTIESATGEFDSKIMAYEGTFEHTFTESGTFVYFCKLHPWMTGTVQVN